MKLTENMSYIGPTIISGFVFDTAQSTLLTMSTGAACVAGMLLALLIAKHSNRTTTCICIFLLSSAGCAMMVWIPSEHLGARYGGYILGVQCKRHSSKLKKIIADSWSSTVSNCVPFAMTYLTAGVGGTTKKFSFSSAFQLGYALGNIIGPQTFRPKDAPTYYVSSEPWNFSSSANNLLCPHRPLNVLCSGS